MNTNPLHSVIQSAAERFAAEILDALRAMPLDAIIGTSAQVPMVRNRPAQAPADGRRPRRSATDIEGTVEAIVALLAKTPDGMKAEDIKSALGIAANHWAKPIAAALESGVVTKTGAKRATRYAVGGKAAGPGSGGMKKKTAAKKRVRG